uniref:Uncharacterized protein n=1 Tax=Arundo donax TaxID=35708 RepID=A0A0A9HLU2_ARUDO
MALQEEKIYTVYDPYITHLSP